MLFKLTDQHSIANQFLYELRDKEIQQDRMRFRRNVERLGEIMAYEISKRLIYKEVSVQTPLMSWNVKVPSSQPVLISVLRAGLPYFQGFLNFFDRSSCGFIGAYREEGKDLKIKLDYLAAPEIEGREVVIIDPMLATGNSLFDSIQWILKKGQPAHTHIVSLIAAPEGVKFLQHNLKIPYSLWTCALDEKLDANYYIIPGLGDAGDLSYGNKY